MMDECTSVPDEKCSTCHCIAMSGFISVKAVSGEMSLHSLSLLKVKVNHRKFVLLAEAI